MIPVQKVLSAYQTTSNLSGQSSARYIPHRNPKAKSSGNDENENTFAQVLKKVSKK